MYPLPPHSITLTRPIKIHFVVVYRPPGQLGSFLEELDVLLSSYTEDGSPLGVLGDFNIHLEKPQAAYFHTLLASFDLKRVSTAATHKSGNQLDVFTRATAPLTMHWSLRCTLQITSSSLSTSTCLRTQHTLLHRSPFGKTYAHSHPLTYPRLLIRRLLLASQPA